MSSKDRSGLIKKIEKYYEENREKSLYFYPLAVLYCEEGEDEKAYQILLEGLKHYPRYILALLKIADILIKEKRYESASAYLETVLNIQKNNTKAMNNLALVYENLGKYKESLKIYETLSEMEPDNEQLKSKILELAPLVKPADNDIDNLLEEINSSEGEKKEDVAESKSEDINNNNNRGDALSQEEIVLEDMPEVNLEDDGDEDDEEEEVVSVTLAKLYEKQGHIEEALKIYEKIVEKEPDNVEAKESLERIKNEMEKKDEKND